MTETPEQLPAEGEDKDKEHPQGGPPGQTGAHPQGGPPGQTGEHPQGGPPGQDKPEPNQDLPEAQPGPQPPEPTQLPAEGGEDEEGTEAKP